MDYKKLQLQNSKIEITVNFSDEDIKKHTETANKNIAGKDYKKERKIDDKMSKEDIFKSELQNICINTSLYEVIQKENITVISQPQISLQREGKQDFVAILEIKPDFDISNEYKKASIKKEVFKIKEEEILKEIEMLRGNVAELKEIDAKASNGNKVLVDFEGFDMDGKAFPNTKGNDFDMEIGTGKMIPGFEEECIGMKKGEEKEFKIVFPENYHAKEMAGKPFNFKVKVKKVQEKVLPELNEALVEKLMGKKESVDFLKKEVENAIKARKENEEKSKNENILIDKWSKLASFDIPLSDISRETEMMIDQVKMQGLQMGMPWEKYLEQMGKTEESFKDDFQEQAKGNVRKRYVVWKIIEKEGIKLDQEKMNNEIKKYEEDAKAKGQKFDKEFYSEGGKGYMQLANSMLIGELFDRFV